MTLPHRVLWSCRIEKHTFIENIEIIAGRKGVRYLELGLHFVPDGPWTYPILIAGFHTEDACHYRSQAQDRLSTAEESSLARYSETLSG